MKNLLEKGDVFKLKSCGSVVAASIAGKYIVTNVAYREWYGSLNWKYKTKKLHVFCESIEPQGTKISFFQSEENLRIFGLKILEQPTQGLEIELLEEEKAAAKENYSVERATTEKIEKLLKKGDVFVLEYGQKHAVLMGNSEIEYYPCREKSYLAGKYVVFHVEETGIKGLSWIYKVFCMQVKNPVIVISFYQSVQHSPVISNIKVIGHATPGKWDIKYFDKNEPIETTLREKSYLKENTKGYSVEWEKTEKMGNQKADKDTSNVDWGQIFKDYSVKYGSPLPLYKDAIDNVIKDAIESTAHKIIKEFREGIKKVIGN